MNQRRGLRHFERRMRRLHARALMIPIVSESIIELARTERSIAMSFGSRDSSRPAPRPEQCAGAEGQRI